MPHSYQVIRMDCQGQNRHAIVINEYNCYAISWLYHVARAWLSDPESQALAVYHGYIMALGLCMADTAHSKQLAKHGACMRALDVLTLTEDMKQRYDKIVGDYNAKITDDQLREVETPSPTTNRESYVTLLSRFTQLNQVLYRTLPVKVFLNKVNTFRSCTRFS